MNEAPVRKYKRMKFKGVIRQKCDVSRADAQPAFAASAGSHSACCAGSRTSGLRQSLPFLHRASVRPHPQGHRAGRPRFLARRRARLRACTRLRSHQPQTEEQDLERPGRATARTASRPRSAPRPSVNAPLVDLEKIAADLRVEIAEFDHRAEAKKLAKRLKIVDSSPSREQAERMIMTSLPVIPPERRPSSRWTVPVRHVRSLRPLLSRDQLQQSPKRLIELRAPDIIIRNEKRMPQEAVDALFDNGCRGGTITGANKRPLKSLSDMLKGKQGRSARTCSEARPLFRPSGDHLGSGP